MKYRVKIEREIETQPKERYSSFETIYEQIFETGSDDEVKKVIKSVNGIE